VDFDTIPSMNNLSAVILQLKKARTVAHQECERIDAALSALGSIGHSTGRSRATSRTPHRMSIAARRRIAAAQRARWAKWKAARRQGKKAA